MRWADLVQQLQLDLLWSLVVAVLLGGAVGLERELRGKAAGLRTNILICLGATLFTHLSIHLAGPSGDPGRIAAQVVTGIGFLGAGTILHTRGAIAGLTSAATIWLVAAIGVAIGAGAIFEAAGAPWRPSCNASRSPAGSRSWRPGTPGPRISSSSCARPGCTSRRSSETPAATT